MADLVPCLYCRDTSRPKTSEHVVQKGFGGNLTLPNDVCDDCNTRVFAPLDKVLIDDVKDLMAWDSPALDGRLGLLKRGFPLELRDGVWSGIRLGTDNQPTASPEVIFLSDTKVRISMDARVGDYRSMIKTIQAELADPSSLVIKPLIMPNTDPSKPEVQPALVRSAEKRYAIRASSEVVFKEYEARVLSGTLLQKLDETAEVESIRHQPKMEVALTFDLGTCGRALAKMALNFLAATVGPAVARDPAFDRVRNHVLSGAGDHDRVVEWTFGAVQQDNALERLTLDGHHTLTLVTDEDGRLLMLVTLYGRPIGVVLLAEVCPIDLEAPIVGLFDHKARQHRVLRGAQDIHELVRLFPGFFKIPRWMAVG